MATKGIKRGPSSYLVSIADEPKRVIEPIKGYAAYPLLSLEEACEPLHAIIPELTHYVHIAKKYSKHPADNLTRDESAAIRLYTMQWDPKINNSQTSLYTHLNRTLRQPDRTKLKPWFLFLKLLLTALIKLPPVSGLTVWRGIRNEDSAKYVEGDEIVWWGFSSCTKSLNVLKSDAFFGTDGKRSLFSVQIFDGRLVQDYSDFPNEDEVLLLPGTYLKVHAKINPAPDLHIIQLIQIHSQHELLERPFLDDPWTHTIVTGDTFWLLAQKYDCSLDEIQAVNPNINPNKLEVGQEVRLPSSCLNSKINRDIPKCRSDMICHTVLTGDTCERIAEWYGCTIDDIVMANKDIQPNLVYPGQTLWLPRTSRTKHIPHHCKH